MRGSAAAHVAAYLAVHFHLRADTSGLVVAGRNSGAVPRPDGRGRGPASAVAVGAGTGSR